MIWRLVLVAVVVAVVVGGRSAALAWQRRARDERPAHPPVPTELLGGRRTWIVFTSPWCASCGPAAEHLRRAEPESAITLVDVAERSDLARAFSVRRTPTALLADADGRVEARLVGAESVRSHTAAPAA